MVLVGRLLLKKNEHTNNRNYYKICNGFNGYNGNYVGCNGHSNGPCGSLLVNCFLLLVVCIVLDCHHTSFGKVIFNSFNFFFFF